MDENRQSYMVIICYFKLYPVVFLLKWLHVHQPYRLSGEMMFMKSLPDFYRTAIIFEQMFCRFSGAMGFHYTREATRYMTKRWFY